jgi:hypothetical protein
LPDGHPAEHAAGASVPKGRADNSPRFQRWGEQFHIAKVPKGRLNEGHVLRENIKSQEEHHRKMTVQEEFLALLKKHRIAFDERYLWE